MRIHLAPMEGVVDHTMRTLLTEVGGVDRCVTEFVRITDQRLPPRVFYRLCPELRNQGKTANGIPVYVQLLGGKPEFMAVNAERAAELGAPGIDINFGCPAKQVNKNDGGSIILREPQRVYDITRAVRDAVNNTVPVTVKMRLGYDNADQFIDTVDAIVEAGADELTVHARTKVDGYKPPAFWSEIRAAKERHQLPIYANGEIWSFADYQQCVAQSGCDDVMLGRGLLSRPGLALLIKNHSDQSDLSWFQVLALLLRFSDITHEAYDPRYVGNRVKQWLGYLRQYYTEASELFETVKRMRSATEIRSAILKQRDQYEAAA